MKHLKTLSASLSLMLALATTSVGAAPTLFGTSLNGHYYSNPGPSTLYTIDQTSGAGTAVGSIGFVWIVLGTRHRCRHAWSRLSSWPN